MKTKRKITLSMIVRNEEKYLGDCLQSVAGIADEIVIVDTGSSDKTIEIALSFGAQIYHFQWCNDFAAARNFALEKSAGDWILYLDADERLAPGSGDKLLQIAEDKCDGKFAVRCLVNSADGESGNPKLMKYTRFFMNSSEIYFKGKVHEQIDDSLLKEKFTFVDSDIEILHLGYSIDKSGINEKARRNLELLLSEYSANPSSYYEYHLGITYDILGFKNESAKYFTRAIRDKNLVREYRAISYLNLAVFYSSEQYDFILAEEMLNKGLENEPDNVMLNLVASEIYYKTGKTGKALQLCVNALNNNKKMAAGKLSASVFGVLVNPGNIVSRGLWLAIQMQDQTAFELFMSEAGAELKLIVQSVLEKKELTETQISWIVDEINGFNSDLFLLLCEICSDTHSVSNLLMLISEKYPSEVRYTMARANLCYKNNDLSGAEKFYRKALSSGQKDPSPVFYLVSVYVAQNEYSKIPDLLEYAEGQFGGIPVFKEKMDQLKQKLLGVL